QIRAAEQTALDKAEDAWIQNQFQIVEKQTALVESYRKSYRELLTQTASLQKDFDSLAMEKIKFNQGMKTAALDQQVKELDLLGKKNDARNAELSNWALAGKMYNSETAAFFDKWEKDNGFPPGYAKGYLDT